MGGEASNMARTWFVTGAARGIGAEIVKAALDVGDNVVATGRDRQKVEKAFLVGRDRLLPLALVWAAKRRGTRELWIGLGCFVGVLAQWFR